MKKLIFLIMFASLAISVKSQDGTETKQEERKEIRKEKHAKKITLKELKGKPVSYQAKQQFQIDFGDHPDAKWVRTDYFDQVTFTTRDGKQMTAYYDDDAQLVGTTAPATFNDLPEAGKREIAKHYQNYENALVLFFDDNENNDTDMLLYGYQFDDADNYFIELKDAKGRPIVLRVSMDGEVTYFADMR